VRATILNTRQAEDLPGGAAKHLPKMSAALPAWTSTREYKHILWVHVSHGVQLCALCVVAVMGRLHTDSISEMLWDLPVGSSFAASLCLVVALLVSLCLVKSGRSKARGSTQEPARESAPEPARVPSRASGRGSHDDSGASSSDDNDDDDKDEETGVQSQPETATTETEPTSVAWAQLTSAAVVKPATWVVVCVPFTLIVSALDREWFWVVAFAAAAAAAVVFLGTWIATEAINDKTAARVERRRTSAGRHLLDLNAGKHARAATVVTIVQVLVLAVLEVALFEARVLRLAHVVLSALVFVAWTMFATWDAARLRAVAVQTHFAASKNDSAEWMATTQTLCGVDFVLRMLLEDVYRARAVP
jgi:uncharacterized membrane protein YhaH (DUF805 family)